MFWIRCVDHLSISYLGFDDRDQPYVSNADLSGNDVNKKEIQGCDHRYLAVSAKPIALLQFV